MNQNKFAEFIIIARKLNELDIVPLLIGSVGLEIITNMSWQAQDLDIHVPGDRRGWEIEPELVIDNWNDIVKMMKSIGYTLIDLHEHEFEKKDLLVRFGVIDTLPSFAGVNLEDLAIHSYQGVKYYLLNHKQYLSVYESSAKDSYRTDKNNHKDIAKIEFLKRIIKS
ncbi:phosphoribosylanthranilate isomerase [Amphibacillus indicireducens]|uniref:Phosphoribosylanthranilate isomerase n=1 Tax=Amphibacillus indicireducens TaxID=1076330 RepID=A0ABP7VQK4_9BACI